MKVLILGGDGYLGWPTAMHFSAREHDVVVVDDFTRRHGHLERGTDSLTPISALHERIDAWHQVSGRTIEAHVFDVCDYARLRDLIAETVPDTIIHYGQLPSAPYSMIDREHAVDTQVRNVVGNLNVIWAMHEAAPDAHLVKLGTMGEYGTPNIDIEEGYLEIEHRGRTDTLPFPKLPGSFYHLSKVHDSHNIHFACRIWGLRATELNQGVVYGIQTAESATDSRLATRFDYDEVFGTALNRFCVQAVVGDPLTVYGRGTQRRGFLNVVDTLRCVELAALHPADRGEMRIYNQFTETFTILELAEAVQAAAVEIGYECSVSHLENPRVELEEHYYNPTHTKLLDLGLEPRLLSDELVATMLHVIEQHKDRVRPASIAPSVAWR